MANRWAAPTKKKPLYELVADAEQENKSSSDNPV
jgi:hypothetical protein